MTGAAGRTLVPHHQPEGILQGGYRVPHRVVIKAEAHITRENASLVETGTGAVCTVLKEHSARCVARWMFSLTCAMAAGV